VRFVENVWPHKTYPFLYGSIPQTWESPNFEHEFTGFEGDNDPMDLFDIGQNPGFVGQIKQVKLLGGLALNDGNETDWKMLGIDVTDPIADLVDSYQDVEKYRPGLTQALRDWFTYYKVARGDGVLEIIGESYQDAEFCVATVAESHGFWMELVAGTVDTNEINYNQTSTEGLDSYVEAGETESEFEIPTQEILPAEPVPAVYREWVYLDEEHALIEQE
jgi:inorganic pyrophosphatase